jgi:L-aminopeptidase/D-esterase-like protein
LFDLNIGDPKIHPNAAAGYAACEAAAHDNIPEGCVGAGSGATVGKLFGQQLAMKSGIGTASWTVPGGGLVVGALVAVNAVGDVRDYRSGEILAGARRSDGSGMLNSMHEWMSGKAGTARHGANTTIGIVATNAAMNKVEASKVAQMAHDGLARTINPVHTMFDGDTIFAAATGSSQASHDTSLVGAIAAEVMARAVNRAVLSATGLPGLPSHRDLFPGKR